MKRIVLVLVLLVTWSLASVPSLTSPAQAGEIQIPENPQHGSNGNENLEPTGDADDGSAGDPGDLGDGYGAVGNPRFDITSSTSDLLDWSALEEYLIFLALMVQQLAP